MLKIATFGFAIATLALIYLLFVGWLVWSLTDFDCAGSYWQCHGNAVPDLAIYVGVPVLGWATYGWLLIRAWKKD